MQSKKPWFALLLFVLSMTSLNGTARHLSAQSTPAATKDAQEYAAHTASLLWLKLIDSDQYQSSWTSSASFFRRAVTESQWDQALHASRGPLGRLLQRQVKQTTLTHTLPGAPDGDYMVTQFGSSFENKAAAIETVTTSHEKDGSWQVCGYYIR